MDKIFRKMATACVPPPHSSGHRWQLVRESRYEMLVTVALLARVYYRRESVANPMAHIKYILS